MSRPPRTANGRIAGLTWAELVGDVGETEDDDDRPADGPDEAADLGDGAGTESQERPDDDQQDRDQVQRVHRPIVAQAPKRRWRRVVS